MTIWWCSYTLLILLPLWNGCSYRAWVMEHLYMYKLVYDYNLNGCRLSLSFFLSTATMAWVLPHGAHLRLECSLENTTRKLYHLIAGLRWKITKYVFTRLNVLLFKVACYSVFSSTFVVDLNYFFCYIFMLLLKSHYWMLISPLVVSWWLKQSALYWGSVPSSLVLSLHRLCAYVVCVW